MTFISRCWQQDRRSCCSVMIVVVYLLLAHFTFGNRVDQFVGCGIMLLACAWSTGSRRFARGMFPFLMMGMVYDCLRLLQPLLKSLSVWVAQPYLIEKALFGLGSGSARITLNEFFASHHWPGADLACGVAYMIYLYVALGFAVVIALAGRHQKLLSRYGWTFFFVNVAAFATYCLCPTAPPWYVATHGLGPADITTPPNPAALVRFDAMVGVPYFAEFYRRSADVFGSIPSLHCAYPLVVLLYARELRNRWLNAVFFGFYLLVVFSAVYLQHHYLLDVLLGTLYAGTGYVIECAHGTTGRRGSPPPPADRQQTLAHATLPARS
jgi:membrane-associated phospholipid phosphatase